MQHPHQEFPHLALEIEPALLNEAASELKGRILRTWAQRFVAALGLLLAGLELLGLLNTLLALVLIGFYGLSVVPVLTRRASVDAIKRTPGGATEWSFFPQGMRILATVDGRTFDYPRASIRGIVETNAGLALEHEFGWLLIPGAGLEEEERRAIRRWVAPLKEALAAKTTPVAGPKGRTSLSVAVMVLLAWGTLILVFFGIWTALAPKPQTGSRRAPERVRDLSHIRSPDAVRIATRS